MKLSDRYLKIVEWSEEDGCYVGRCPGLMLGGVHGMDALYPPLQQKADEVMKEKGFTGKNWITKDYRKAEQRLL